MKIRLLLAVFAVLAVGGCGPETESDEVSVQEPEFLNEDSREGLVISPRTFTGGTVTAKVSGFFEVDGSQSLNVPASISDGVKTWLQYGVSGSPGLDVLFTNSLDLAEHGVMVGVGSNTVTTTSTSGECQTQVDVTPTLITGRYSCTGSTGYNSQTGQMGEVDVEVEFSAGS